MEAHLRNRALGAELSKLPELEEADRGVGGEELLGLRAQRDQARVVVARYAEFGEGSWATSSNVTETSSNGIQDPREHWPEGCRTRSRS
jgi:hypothetical protein